MLQRIAKLFRQEPKYTRVKMMTVDGVRLTIDRFERPCGHPGFMLGMEIYLVYRDKWLPIACFSDLDVEAAQRLLKDAGEFIEAELAPFFVPQQVN